MNETLSVSKHRLQKTENRRLHIHGMERDTKKKEHHQRITPVLRDEDNRQRERQRTQSPRNHTQRFRSENCRVLRSRRHSLFSESHLALGLNGSKSLQISIKTAGDGLGFSVTVFANFSNFFAQLLKMLRDSRSKVVSRLLSQKSREQTAD